jgi:hypothetical protein
MIRAVRGAIRAVPESEGAGRRRTDLPKTVAHRSYRLNAVQAFNNILTSSSPAV